MLGCTTGIGALRRSNEDSSFLYSLSHSHIPIYLAYGKAQGTSQFVASKT